ncbi:MAG TPA: vWA domain-containing protein [Polyangiaceae bacterium]|nr:vWA domain-containing protein [Polyangiaceae bacterium]
MLPFIGMGAALACSPSKGGNHGLGGDNGGSSGTAGSTSGAGGGTGGGIGVGGGAATGGGVMLAGTGSGATSGAGSGGTDTCAAMFTPGMPVPVDVYVMLDISGSMLDPAGGAGAATTKWTAVQSALSAFFADASSAGLSVAIQYFPQRVPGVPSSCMSDAECLGAAPCLMNICQQFPDGMLVPCTPGTDPNDTAPCSNVVRRDSGPCMDGVCHLSGKKCASNTECQTVDAALGRCIQYGNCEADATLSCGVANPGKPQAGCGPNGGAGLCLPAASSFCAHETVCEPNTYKTPAVDYLTLPDTANSLTTSVTAQMPIGDTPSLPALLGAIGHARDRAKASVGHSQVVLLATDGMPTDCTSGREVSSEIPAALDDVVGVATEGYTPAGPNDASVTTFVIGVFAEGDATAQTNLDRIAKAGGSDHAFVISSGGDVQQQFLTALANIRKSRVGCEFLPPPPPPGQTLDWNLVNVTVQSEAGNKELVNVEPTACTGMTDEWHYDCNIRDKSAMCKPTKLIACPKTCEDLSKQAASGVTVGLGCAIKVR